MCQTNTGGANFSTTWVMIYDAFGAGSGRWVQTGFKKIANSCLNYWAEINDGDPADAALTAVTLGAPFRKCIPTDEYESYIDLIVLGRRLARDIVPGSFQRVVYAPDDAGRFDRLSDHCPVGIELRLR